MSRVSRIHQPPETNAAAVSTFLRSLADRVQNDPALASQIHAALLESGLLSAANVPAPASPQRRRSRSTTPAAREAVPLALEPFAVLRERGEPGLQASLELLDLPSLRQIVRVHRLDPARISARWTARDRIITLIVDQVRARANHGKAFSHI